MEPPPRARMIGIACLQDIQWLFRFTAKLRSNASSVRSTATASPSAMLAPTLLWRMSRAPWLAAAPLMSFTTEFSSVASTCAATASPPASTIMSTVSWADARSRSATTTLAPSRPNTIAVALPFPMVVPRSLPTPYYNRNLPSHASSHSFLLNVSRF